MTNYKLISFSTNNMKFQEHSLIRKLACVCQSLKIVFRQRFVSYLSDFRFGEKTSFHVLGFILCMACLERTLLK